MKAKGHFQKLRADRRTYQMDFKERVTRMLTGFISFRTAPKSDLLQTRY